MNPDPIAEAWVRFNPRLRRFISRYVQNPAQIDDVLSACWILAIQKWDTCREESKRLSWMHSIIANYVIAQFRDRRIGSGAREQQVEWSDWDRHALEPSVPGPFASIEARRCVIECLPLLTPAQRLGILVWLAAVGSDLDLDGVGEEERAAAIESGYSEEIRTRAERIGALRGRARMSEIMTGKGAPRAAAAKA